MENTYNFKVEVNIEKNTVEHYMQTNNEYSAILVKTSILQEQIKKMQGYEQIVKNIKQSEDLADIELSKKYNPQFAAGKMPMRRASTLSMIQKQFEASKSPKKNYLGFFDD